MPDLELFDIRRNGCTRRGAPEFCAVYRLSAPIIAGGKPCGYLRVRVAYSRTGPDRNDSADGLTLQAWLGMGDELQAPWLDDGPLVVTEAELSERFSDHPGIVGEMRRLGFIERQGNTRPATYVMAPPYWPPRHRP